MTKSLIRTLSYVACSRATAASGLFIIGTFTSPKTIETDSRQIYNEIICENRKN